MNAMIKSVYLAGSIVCMLIASGCVVISRDHKVSEIREYPQMATKPAICLGSTTFSYYLDGVKSLCPNSIEENGIAFMLRQRFENSTLYSKVSKSESVSDYRIEFEAKRDFKMTGGSIPLTVVTLGVIPNSTRRKYEWTAHIKNIKNGEVRSVHVEEEGDGFEHLLCLPFAIFFGSMPIEGRIYRDLSQNMIVAVNGAIKTWGTGGHDVACEAKNAAPNVEAKTVENGLAKKLKALKDAREAGVLTEQEYQTKRAEALKGL